MSSIKDVAKLAGVGLGTVSRVTNNSGYVSPETREKVEHAIKVLGYEPNEMAKSLLKNNSMIVALILPTIHHPLFSKFAYYVEKTLNQHGYKLFICNSDFEVKKELEYIRMLNKKIIDGIIFISNSDINDYITPDLPIVTIDRHLCHEMIYISSDNYQGGRMAAKHLVDKRCTNIAFVGGFPEVETEVHKRKQGFIDYLNEKEINYTIYEEKNGIEDMNAFAQAFVEKYPSIDGIFALTDMLAYQLVHQLTKRNVKIPEQVKVVGYDGIDMFNTVQKSLTTIVQPIDEMGISAAKSILDLIKNKRGKREIILPVELFIGETT